MHQGSITPGQGILRHTNSRDELEEDAQALLFGLSDILTLVSDGAPAIAEALRLTAARWPHASCRVADPAFATAPLSSATTPTRVRPPVPDFVIDRETAEWMRKSVADRVRVIELASPMSDRPSRSATREPPAPELLAPPRSPPPYYSLDHLPPLTSERAFRRHLKAGLPVTRIGYGEVVTPAAWLAWLGAQAKPRASAARAALPPAPSDDELLATVGAKPRSKR